MSDRSDALLIEDIIESIEKIFSYTRDVFEDHFYYTDMIKDAVARNFSIIGEAAGKLSDKFRQQHNKILWREIKDFRNIIVHEYFGLDYKTMWKIIQDYLPDLHQSLSLIKKENE